MSRKPDPQGFLKNKNVEGKNWADVDHEVSVLVTFCSLSVLKTGGFASWRQAP